jgi:hypothetical protein
MGVTLEYVMHLTKQDQLARNAEKLSLNVLRKHGVRRDNVYDNTQSRMYAFNGFQQSQLPPVYRPPKGSAGGGAA